MDEIDGILARYEQELLYFEYTKDELEPLMEDLLGALDAYFSNRDDPQVLEGAKTLRLILDAGWRSLALFESWASIRGSNDLLGG